MITSVYAFLTNRCNLDCAYCYEKERRGDMEWSTMEQLIEFLIRQHKLGSNANLYSHFNLNLFGGEPMLNWDVMKKTFEYVEEIKRDRGLIFSIQILTNGTIWNPEIDAFFRKWKPIMLERLKFQISIDGCEASHNVTRRSVSGVNAYPLIMENAKKYRAIFHDLQVRETLVPENVDRFYDDYVALSSVSDTVQMTPIVEADWFPVLDKAKEQVQKIYDLFFQQLRETPTRFLSLISSSVLEANERRSGCYSPGDYKGCHAGHQLIGVSTEGFIYPCHRHVAYSKQFDYKIGDIWDGIDVDSPKFKEIDAMHFANKECSACKSFTCNRCYATNKYLTGEFSARPKTGYCEFCAIIQEFVNKYSDDLFYLCANPLNHFSSYKSPTSKKRGLIMSKGKKILAADAEDLLVQSMVQLLRIVTEVTTQQKVIIKYLHAIAGDKAPKIEADCCGKEHAHELPAS